MGESKKRTLGLCFDRHVKLEFHGANISSDAGLLAYRELDEVLGLTASGGNELFDLRSGRNIQHDMTMLLRQSIYGRLAGYEDLNDAERLSVDPVMRQVVGGRSINKQAASTSLMARFETDVLTDLVNLTTLADLSGQWIDHVRRRKPLKRLILDLDSSVSETHGQQEGSQYNGHFECNCYHPLFCFNQDGDTERSLLREGHVHSADDWESVLLPVIERYRDDEESKFFRADAAFAIPAIYQRLESEDYGYAIRLKGNAVLYRRIQDLLKRPVGRPSFKPRISYASFQYQASSWDRPRRVVAKVEWYAGELYPRIGFIVTNLRWNAKRVVRFYNGRGTAEQWIKEGKYALNWTRLSCHGFEANQVRLQLFTLAYNLGNFLRRLALPKPIRHWSLTTLKAKLIKIGAKVIRHARYIRFQMAEVAVSRDLFKSILNKIHGLVPPEPVP
ncbi:MAG: IS1380 family transposase [Gammaproteobacteria bacterium]|nr:IS1380 family transposase [Gammaproteobacteria bacterium]